METKRRKDIANKEIQFLKDNERPDPNIKGMPFRYNNMRIIVIFVEIIS